MEPISILEQIAEQVRDQARSSGGILREPISGIKETLDDDRLILTRLLRWGIFNPFGPTVAALSTIRLTTGESMLTFQLDNPFSEEGAVLGLVATVDADVPFEVLESLFALTLPDGHPLFGSLPTHLIHAGNDPDDDETEVPVLDASTARELMWIAARTLEVPEDELAHSVELLETFRGDPWGRAGRERDEAFSSPEVLRMAERLKRLSMGLSLEDPDAPDGAEAASPPTRSTFDRWFDLVTDREHVRSEVEEIPAAWVGATRFATGEGR